jgi:hypothetical protein
MGTIYSYFNNKEVVCIECGTKYVPVDFKDGLEGEKVNLCSVGCLIKNNNKIREETINISS